MPWQSGSIPCSVNPESFHHLQYKCLMKGKEILPFQEVETSNRFQAYMPTFFHIIIEYLNDIQWYIIRNTEFQLKYIIYDFFHFQFPIPLTQTGCSRVLVCSRNNNIVRLNKKASKCILIYKSSIAVGVVLCTGCLVIRIQSSVPGGRLNS